MPTTAHSTAINASAPTLVQNANNVPRKIVRAASAPVDFQFVLANEACHNNNALPQDSKVMPAAIGASFSLMTDMPMKTGVLSSAASMNMPRRRSPEMVLAVRNSATAAHIVIMKQTTCRHATAWAECDTYSQEVRLATVSRACAANWVTAP